jgi:hypothetical protein
VDIIVDSDLSEAGIVRNQKVKGIKKKKKKKYPTAK